MAADDPSNACTRDFFDPFGELEDTSALLGRSDHRMGQDVRRDLVEGCRHAEYVVRGQRARWHDGRERRMASRQGPRLVDQQCRALRQAFEHGATLDHDPPSRRMRQPSDEGHRCGQDERARCGHHEDGDGPRRGQRRPTRRPPRPDSRRGTRLHSDRPSGRTGPARTPPAATSRTIPAYALSEARAVTRRSNGDPALTTPLRTGSPDSRVTGSASPVSVDSSSTALVSRRPSHGTSSPDCTRRRSPGSTPSAATVRSSSPW